MFVVIDYDMGNLKSMSNALKALEIEHEVSGDPARVCAASAIILPGVGAFAAGMQQLQQRNLDAALTEEVCGKGVPFLGICLGMQLLAKQGYEGGVATPGLGWVDGEVHRLQPAAGERLPHVGWNEVKLRRESGLFAQCTGTDFYFVHSYHVLCRNEEQVLGTTDYAGGFVSALHTNNIFGVQFHPEKSQRLGLQLLKNFLQGAKC